MLTESANTVEGRASRTLEMTASGMTRSRLPRGSTLGPWAATGLAIVLVLGLAGCSHRGLPGQNQPIYKLANDFDPLRAQFNRDADKVRLLMLLDPT